MTHPTPREAVEMAKSKSETIRKAKWIAKRLPFYIVYSTHYQTDRGYYIRKRLWLFVLLAPVLIPFFMLFGAYLYIQWVYGYEHHWVSTNKKELSFIDKLSITWNLK